MKVVGKDSPKIDGMAIATGRPVYTEDLAPKDALVIKILRSPHAFARIKSIDTSRAVALEGVECVFTYQDVPGIRFTLAGQSYPEPSPYDRLILDEIVRYVGDEVAIVAAVDERTALNALKRIKVQYEVLEPVLDLATAIDHPSIVHPEDNLHLNFDIGMEKERNIISYQKVEAGEEIEEALRQCDVVVEETVYTQAQSQAMMETFRAFSYLDHANRLVITSSTQVPFHIRRQIARAFSIPASRVRVIKPRIGGGFGAKQTGCCEVFSALVTLKTGKPSIIVYDRRSTFNSSTSRHAMKMKVRLGADKDGMIRAYDLDVLSDGGAYGEHSSTTLGCVGEKTMSIYNKTKAVRFTGTAVYTNKQPGGAFRGYGATQGTMALETAVNKLAAELQMDPTEIRLKNLIEEGETSLVYNGKVIKSTTLKDCIRKGKELIGWDEKYPRQVLSNGKIRAVGMAVTQQGSGIAGIDTASAEIRLNDEGSYNLLLGSTDMGTGSDTILSQMAAEVLETTVDQIAVYAGDTDTSPYDPGSYASSTTYVTGMAVVQAAEELKEKILTQGARYMDRNTVEVEFNGKAVVTLDGKTSITLEKIAELNVLGSGRHQLVGNATYGSPVSPPPYMVGFAEVEVDPQTGKVEPLDFVAVIDCGTVINPNLARIQAEGGLVQGIGMALYEEVRYDSKGRMYTNDFMQYKIPTRKDVGNIRVHFIESYEPTGPFGAKSIGEVVANTPAPAIAHAVFNATGFRVTELPITPEKVFLGQG
ncbi:MAG: xanthine dehydrogenase family protein molybdopterin-binding subunit [Desulfitobacterium sp.]